MLHTESERCKNPFKTKYKSPRNLKEMLRDIYGFIHEFEILVFVQTYIYEWKYSISYIVCTISTVVNHLI